MSAILVDSRSEVALLLRTFKSRVLLHDIFLGILSESHFGVQIQALVTMTELLGHLIVTGLWLECCLFIVVSGVVDFLSEITFLLSHSTMLHE